MEFEINDSKWIIRVVDEATINNEMKRTDLMGITKFMTNEVWLLKNQGNIIKTLKHELTHVWLYEYGHCQDDEFHYNAEDICEIVASSNNFVNKITDRFIKCMSPKGKHESKQVSCSENSQE